MLQSAAVGFSPRVEPSLDGGTYTWDLAVYVVYVNERSYDKGILLKRIFFD